MTTLDDLLKSLSLSILNNTSVVTDNKSSIEPDKLDYILEFVNEGLTRLHSRFVLKSNTLYIEMNEGRTTYPLQQKYAYTQYDPMLVQYPYIMDSEAYPFMGDVIKVLNAYDNQGNRRTLNDSQDEHGLFTPRPDTINCIRPRHREIISIIYQAKHPIIRNTEDTQEIDIPDTLLPALKYWVGYSYYTGLNTQENTGKAAEYLQMYESICKEVEEYDLANGSTSTTNVLFSIRGWI